MFIPNSVNPFLSILVIILPCLSKLSQSPLGIDAPLLNAQKVPAALQPSPPTVSTKAQLLWVCCEDAVSKLPGHLGGRRTRLVGRLLSGCTRLEQHDRHGTDKRNRDQRNQFHSHSSRLTDSRFSGESEVKGSHSEYQRSTPDDYQVLRSTARTRPSASVFYTACLVGDG